ncbi:MAG: protein adenylyltransferase SelO [Polynucleobacter victoriensis]
MAFHLPFTDNLALVQSISPTPIPNPYWVGFSASVADLLGIQVTDNLPSNPDYLHLLAGNQSRIGDQSYKTYATAYSGHQFGSWAGQLGDGRAIYLGDIHGQEVQLKGAGQTAYSRMGDGRAVLRSSIREFLCSEAMHFLGVPTSRALAVVGSDMLVIRESPETTAVCTRVAPSFLRIGHIEHYGHNQMWHELSLTLDYLIEHHYPECHHSPTPYLALLDQISLKTARMVAQWQSLGFCHGVLNTDNTSLLGLTLDYGPFGFLDQFQVDHICNHSDHGGRYSYHRQPEILHWNMYCLASAMLLPLQQELKRVRGIDGDEAIEYIKNTLNNYNKEYVKTWQTLFRKKLGLSTESEQDITLLEELLQTLHREKVDFTLFFRNLSEGLGVPTSMNSWYDTYKERLDIDKQSTDCRLESMQAVNPKYVLRNHLAQHAIELAQKKDFSEVSRLLKILENPYTNQAVPESYALGPPPELAAISISCSS